MYCRHCGRELKGDPNFCRYCGYQLRVNKNISNTLAPIKRYTTTNRYTDLVGYSDTDISEKEKRIERLHRETKIALSFSAFVVLFLTICISLVRIDSKFAHLSNRRKLEEAYNEQVKINSDNDELNNISSDETDAKNVIRRDQTYGSAKLLDGDNLLISIFVNNGKAWRDREKEYCKESMKEATLWIEEVGKQYSKDINFVYNMSEASDLCYDQSIDFKIKSDGDDNNQYDYYLYNKVWLQKNIDVTALKKKYETNSVGFIFFIKEAGTSYTYSHYVEDNNTNKEEMCTIFLEDSSNFENYETPATYAHELLHLYGALDLYEGACPKEINNYVYDTYPREIMLSTYDEPLFSNNYYNRKMLSPITAYMLGWVDDIDELNKFPEMKRKQRACFSEKDFGGYYFSEENK